VSEDRKNNFIRKKKSKKNNYQRDKDFEGNQEHKKVKDFKRRKKVYLEDEEWTDDVDRFN